MSKNLEVSITQCHVCGTISIHWGVETLSCTACSNAMDELHDAIVIEDLGSKIDIEIEDWMNNPDDVKFLLNLDKLVSTSKYDDGSEQPVFGAREWDEINKAIPLLDSIANTITDQNDALNVLLTGINTLLEEPSDHWSYISRLEEYRFKIESKVENINQAITECQHLGYDVVDFEAALISALSNVPEFWFEGKDDIKEGMSACFYYDGSDNEFNSYTQIGEPNQWRRHFNTPE